MLESSKGEVMGGLRGALVFANKSRDTIQQIWNEGEMMITVDQAEEMCRLCREVKKSIREISEVVGCFKDIAAQRRRLTVVQHERVFVPVQSLVERISTDSFEISR